MTDTEFRAWINANINTNSAKAITGAIMHTFGMKCIEYFANIDTPLLPYPLTIADEDLVDLAVTVTHGKNTWLPDFIMSDENGDIIFGEYYTAHVVDANNITFTFNAAIPATGNGYYKLLVWTAGLLNVTARYTNVFTSPFTAWTGDVPDGFTVETTFLGSPTCEESTGRALLTKDGIHSIRLIPILTLEVGREYRVSIKLDSGNIRIVCGEQQFSLNIIGTNIITFTATDTEVKIRNGASATAIIDDLVIDEQA